MAFHDRLTRVQKILLAIFCFPVVPFYLCYACCCATDEEKDEKDEEDKPGKYVKRDDIVFENEAAVDIQLKPRDSNFPKKTALNREHQEENEGNKGSRNRDKETVEIHQPKNKQRLPARPSIGKGKEVGKNYIVYENKAAADIQPKTIKSSLPRKSEGRRSSEETVEIHPQKNAQKTPARLSFGKGKEVRKNDIVYENKGFVDPDNKTSQKTEFAYPWDKSSLKSMHIDLSKLKSLDTYSSKVRPQDTVEALVQLLVKGVSGDLEKLRAIWMWVTHHIEYDVEGLRAPSLRQSGAVDVLRSGKAVCAGYAGLFQEMCRLAGVECEKVSGYSKGAGYKVGDRFNGDTDHAWNAVRLEGRWHLLDSTWGAGNVREKFSFKYNEFYFLTHPALFVGDHFPEDAKWQLLTPQVSLKQYEDMNHKKSSFYNFGLLSTHPEQCLIQSEEKTTVSVQSSSPVRFLHNLNGKSNCGIMTLRPYGMSLDVYPESTGLHTLEIFAKPGESGEKEYSLVCSYQLQCSAVSRDMRPPEDLVNPVGPSWLSERRGLREASQPDPMVHSADGRCAFSFRVAAHLDLMGKLYAAAFSMTDDQQSRHVFLSRQGDWTDFRVQVPRPGLYRFAVYAKDKAEAGSYGHALNYLISCADPRVRWPPYPLTYGTWKDEYELVEPLAGVLPANRAVRFKMRVPDVSQVLVGGGGRDKQALSRDADGYWTGSFSTAGCKDINVMIEVNPSDRKYSFILNYQVEVQ